MSVLNPLSDPHSVSFSLRCIISSLVTEFLKKKDPKSWWLKCT